MKVTQDLEPTAPKTQESEKNKSGEETDKDAHKNISAVEKKIIQQRKIGYSVLNSSI